jgi:hypothetical protein
MLGAVRAASSVNYKLTNWLGCAAQNERGEQLTPSKASVTP